MVQGNYEKIFITTFKLHFFNYYKGHIMGNNLNQALAQAESGDGPTRYDKKEAAKGRRQWGFGFASLVMFTLTMAVSACGSLLLSSDIGQKALKDMRLGTFHNKDLVGKTALGAAILFIISTLCFCWRAKTHGFPELKPNALLATAATAVTAAAPATIVSTAVGSLKARYFNNDTTAQFCSDMEAAVVGAAAHTLLATLCYTGAKIHGCAATAFCSTENNEKQRLLSDNTPDPENPPSATQ
jgi:hypothetical protein